MSFSVEQEVAFELFKKGENLFSTGGGGCGKSWLVQRMVEYAEQNKKNIQVCSTTGCSALILGCNAKTIHSWSGIRLAKGSKTSIIDSTLKRQKNVANWRTVDILVIDEVSMMSQKIFEILEKLGRITRKNHTRAFGGIQVIFCGDFFQLPPVSNDEEEPENGNFCFESAEWFNVFPLRNHIQLKTMFRQRDPLYIDILMQIREGSISEHHTSILQTYINRKYDETSEIVPTKVFATRIKADLVNREMFARIDSPVVEYETCVKVDCQTFLDSGAEFPYPVALKCNKMTELEIEYEIKSLSSNIPSGNSIKLKIGAVVMCNYNLDMEAGICNGSQGIIVGFSRMEDKDEMGFQNQYPIVKFYNGVVRTIKNHYWQSADYPKIAIGMLPLIYSWAVTIHKIQGATLDIAEIDIGSSVFEYGQVYVALSRIKSLAGLYLISFNPTKIKANPKVIAFYAGLPVVDVPQPTTADTKMCSLTDDNTLQNNIIYNVKIKPIEIGSTNNISADSQTKVCSLLPAENTTMDVNIDVDVVVDGHDDKTMQKNIMVGVENNKTPKTTKKVVLKKSNIRKFFTET